MPHCLICQLYEEDGHGGTVLYMEEWDCRAEFDEHIRSELYRRILAAIELSKTPPELHFHQVSATQGLDLVHQLRRSNGAASASNSAN